MKFLLVVISISLLDNTNAQGRTLKKVSSDMRTVEEHYFRNRGLHTFFWDNTRLMATACMEVYRARNKESLKNSPVLNVINNNAKCPTSQSVQYHWIAYQFNNTRPYQLNEIIECTCGPNNDKIINSKKVMDSNVLETINNARLTFYIVKSEGGDSYYTLIKANQVGPNRLEQYFVTEYWKYE